MSIEAVIWDMGGVIMRTEDPGPRTALAGQVGLDYKDLTQRVLLGEISDRAQLGALSAEEFWKRAGALYNMVPEKFMAEFFGGDQIDYELVGEIRKLRRRYKTGLLSNAYSDLRKWIEEWKITDAFDTLVVSAEVKMMKPDPAIYAYTLKQMGVQPHASVFIDDVPANIEAARTAGMQGILFTSRQQAMADLHAILGAG